LILAGNFRRDINKNQMTKLKEREFIYEQRILIKALMGINEPKLVSNDLLLFESLINDLFPDESDNAKDNNESILQYINTIMDRSNLDKNPYFVEKVIQLYHTKNTRHGNIIIGKSMSGKSALLDTLKDL
jgi:dynein heavy chain